MFPSVNGTIVMGVSSKFSLNTRLFLLVFSWAVAGHDIFPLKKRLNRGDKFHPELEAHPGIPPSGAYLRADSGRFNPRLHGVGIFLHKA